MKIIGITGGVGSGKSRVLSYIEEKYNAVICQADQVAWKLQEPGQKSYCEIVDYFGKEILNPDQEINRTKLGAIVFSEEKKLQKLNEITHPAVKEYIQNWIEREKQNGCKLFVIEAALLIEDHYDKICHEMWYIYTKEEIRRIRLKESRNYTDEKIDSMIGNQLSEEEFRKYCQIVIDNSGDFKDTCIHIDKVLEN